MLWLAGQAQYRRPEGGSRAAPTVQATPQRRTPISVDTAASDRELVLTRLIDAPREKLFRAWTEPELLKQWFTPAPYTTPVAELDVRPAAPTWLSCAFPTATSSPTGGSIWKSSKTSAWFLPM